MPMLSKKHRFALLVALATLGAPLAAQAQRKSPLADAPAIRKRFELRSARFELGAGAGTTINQDFYHTVTFNFKGSLHIVDWLSIGGFFGIGVAQVATGFEDRLVTSLATDPSMKGNVNREPLQDSAKAGLQQIPWLAAVQAEFTPFTGKYSLFGKLFAAYDFYAFVGPGFINVKPAGTVRSCDSAPPGDVTSPDRYVCGISGVKIGPTFGVGVHSFFGQSVALGVELRDLMAQLNPSGRDVNGDLVADKNDVSWTHTYMIMGNLLVYLPFTAKISQ
jgi:hypothetical protein